MRAAVTGATGFLGSHLVSALLAGDWSVYGLVRKEAKTGELPTDMNVIVGDICDRGALDRLMTGADVVFHTVHQLS